MTSSLDENLNQAHQCFTQDHDALRKSLLSSLPDSPGQNERQRRHLHLADMAIGNRIVKIAAAAIIIVAVLIGVNYLGGSPDGSTVAWANVATRVAQVDYVHVYIVKSRGENFFGHGEAWHAGGRTVVRGNDGSLIYDDGLIQQCFDSRGMLTVRKPSILANGQTFLEFFSGGFLSDSDLQLNERVPTRVGEDFLIYTFDPPPGSKWRDTTSITVGRNSLLPIQVKVYVDDEDYDLFVFDYEAAEKPPEFFVPPVIDTPNGAAQVVLDGQDVVMDLDGAPGLKQAIVRLHARYDGPADQFPSDYFASDHHSPEFCKSVNEKWRRTYQERGGPVFRCTVSFITDEGYPSFTNDLILLRLDEATQCGVGAGSGGGLDDWPDGKYRNVRFSPWLKPTDTEDIYIVEMRCRIGLKTN